MLPYGEIAHPYVQVSNQVTTGSSASIVATGVASASNAIAGLASASMVAICLP